MALLSRCLAFAPLLLLWLLALAGDHALRATRQSQLEALQRETSGRFAQQLRLTGKTLADLLSGKAGNAALQAFPMPAGDHLDSALLNAQSLAWRASRRDCQGRSAEGCFGPQISPLLQQARDSGQAVVAMTPENDLLGVYPLRSGGADGKPQVLVLRERQQTRLDKLSGQAAEQSERLFALVLTLSLALLFNAWLTVRRQRRLEIAAARGEALAEQLASEHRDLAESEERLNFALTGSNAGIWDWHMDSGHTYYSPRWKTLLGFAESEVLPHAEEWLKRVHPDDLPGVMELLNTHIAGDTGFFESEHRLRRKDGSYLWVLERGSLVRDAEGKPCRMVGALIDISRRKEVESALQCSEAEYRSVVDSVTQVIFRSDERGRLTFLNPAWSELTGFPVDNCLTRTLWDFVPAEDRERVRRLFEGEETRSRDRIEGEFRLFTRDSDDRWFSLHARVVGYGMAGVLTDIDAQKRAQNALAHANSERNTILDLSPAGFVFIDAQRKVAYANPAFLAMTRLQAGELEGIDLPAFENKIKPLCDDQKPVPAFATAVDDREETLYLSHPEKLVLKWLYRSIRDEWEDDQGGVIFFRDVTRETEIDRMKTEFLSTAAHELRTPMASIFGFSELLLAREFDPATQKDLLQTIHRQTKNLIGLLNELLDLARIEARGGKGFKIKEHELAPIILDAVAALYVPAETHRLLVDVPADLPMVNIDVAKFRQCLANVLGNAIKYSPDGGVVRVSTLERLSDAGEGLVGVKIEDEGIGMTENEISHMFDRFYRADASGAIPGTGLGMALVKETMEILGGEVSVSSLPQHGTTVTLWLPYHPDILTSGAI